MLVFTAPTALGPWVVQANANLCDDGSEPVGDFPSYVDDSGDQSAYNPCSVAPPGIPPPPPQTPGPPYDSPAFYGYQIHVNYTTPAQFFWMIEVPGTDTFIAYGEQFHSAADGQKWHDLQAMIPVRFDADGKILPLEFVGNFTLTIPQ